MPGITVFWATGGSGGAANSTGWEEPGQGGTGYTNFYGTRQYQVQDAGTLSNIYANVDANSQSTAGTLATYVGGSAGNESITITTSTLGEVQDTTHTDALTSSSTYAYYMAQSPSGTGTWNAFTLAQQFTPTSSGTLMIGVTDGPNSNYSAGTNYQCPIGQNGVGFTNATTTESFAYLLMQSSYTLQNMQESCDGYIGTPNPAIHCRINAANGNQVVTPTATGNFIDTTHTDNVASGNNLDISVTYSGSNGNYGQTFASLDYVSSSYQVPYVTACSGGLGFTANNTYYLPFCTRLRSFNGAATYATFKTGTTFTASYFQGAASGNTITATTTMSFRRGNANGNQSISWTSGATGWVTDSTHTDPVSPTTEIDAGLPVPNSGTSIILTNAGFTATFSAPATTSVPFQQLFASSNGGLLAAA
jgi:hypothetical protein